MSPRSAVSALILIVFTASPLAATPVRFDFFRSWIMDDNRGYLVVKDNNFQLRFGDGLDDRFTFGVGAETRLRLDTAIIDAVRYRVQINSYTSNAYAHLYFTADVRFRNDLFVHMLIVEKHLGRFYLFAGAETTSVGNWGGEFIQNGFHRLIGYEEVSAPYTILPWTDLSVPLGIRFGFPDVDLKFALFESTAFVEGVIGMTPRAKRSLWTGIDINARSGFVSARMTAGYKLHHVTANDVYTHMYSTGPYLVFSVNAEIGPTNISMHQAYNSFGSRPTEWTADNRQYLWDITVGAPPRSSPGLFFY